MRERDTRSSLANQQTAGRSALQIVMTIFAIVIGQVVRVYPQRVKAKRHFEMNVVAVVEVNIWIDGTEIDQSTDQ